MIRRAAVLVAMVALVIPAAAQQRERASVPDKYKWDLTDIRDAGVDMTTDQPLELTVRKMNRVMDEIESLPGN